MEVAWGLEQAVWGGGGNGDGLAIRMLVESSKRVLGDRQISMERAV